MAVITPELEQLADACGLLTSYEDVNKRRQAASVETLLAGLRALGVDLPSLADVPRALAERRRQQRLVEPVVVAWEGEPLEFDVTLPVRQSTGKLTCSIQSEDKSVAHSRQFDLGGIAPRISPCGGFVTRRLRLDRGLGWGYYQLTIDGDAKGPPSLVISAPRRAYCEEQKDGGEWGCFLPLYALRSERNWGAGDFTDLQSLAKWTAESGGSVVGTLPLLAAFLDEPYEPSPYAPASRLAWNEFYVDVARLPELADCAQAQELLQSAVTIDDIAKLRAAELVDYRRIMAIKRGIMQILADDFFARKPQQRFAEFERFLATHPRLEDYAAFRATYERRREPWSQWPGPQREGRLSEMDYDPGNMRYHLYAQWVATQQLETLSATAHGGLYLDLPLGVRSDGYDVWRWNDAYALQASAGSPPDPVWTKGQNWCFPPLHPQRIREQGYRHVRDYLTHHLRLARLLRIDHVMQLHRLYWIPDGMQASQGVYVRYQPEEFYAILNLESHRCRTTLIGENLGTVPPAVDQAMDRHAMHRMYVVQYEVAPSEDASQPAASAASRAVVAADSETSSVERRPTLSAVPAGALASLNTHDMPTFAAWWRGEDVSLRVQLGLLSEEGAQQERRQFAKTKTQLIDYLRAGEWLSGKAQDEAAVLHALLKYLSASEAGVVLVNLEDLWLETRPQNVPGTGPELPNWRRKAAVPLDDCARRPEFARLLRQIAELRTRAPRSSD